MKHTDGLDEMEYSDEFLQREDNAIITDAELLTAINTGDIIDSDVEILTYHPEIKAKGDKRGIYDLAKRVNVTFDLEGETLSLSGAVNEKWFYKDGEDIKDATCDLKNLYKRKVGTIMVGISGKKINWRRGGDVKYTDMKPSDLGQMFAKEIKSILKDLY